MAMFIPSLDEHWRTTELQDFQAALKGRRTPGSRAGASEKKSSISHANGRCAAQIFMRATRPEICKRDTTSEG